MRLSDAIRLGGMASKQAFGKLMAADGATCAIGSACLAVGIETRYLMEELIPPDELNARLPLMSDPCAVPCPVGDCGGYSSVGDLIVHLNDHHRWTREEIADWVEAYEPRDAVSTASEVSPVLAATRIDP